MTATRPAQVRSPTQDGESSRLRHPQGHNGARVKEMQNSAGVSEILTWIKRGAQKEVGTGIWCSVEGLCIAPVSLLPRLIKEANGVDHVNKAEMIRKIRQEWWSPQLASQVDEVLNACAVCINHNVRKNLTTPLGHISPPTGPFRHLMMSHIDMGVDFQVDGKRYLLVIVDRFSRWVEATATSEEDAESAAKFLCCEFIPRFGIPDFLSSDNGIHFVNNVRKNVASVLKIDHKLGCVYHPESQSTMDQGYRTLTNKLAKICDDSHLNWVQALPLALMKIRSQTNRMTHLTPHEMLTGHPMPMAYTEGPYTEPSVAQLEGKMQDYMRILTQIHRQLYSQVRRAIHGGDEVPEDVRLVAPGDRVHIRMFKRKSPLGARREGPFTVVAATASAVRVEGRDHWYHLNQCVRTGAGTGRRGPATPGPATTGQPTETEVLTDRDSDSDASFMGPAYGTRAQAKRRAVEVLDRPAQSDAGSPTGSSLLSSPYDDIDPVISPLVEAGVVAAVPLITPPEEELLSTLATLWQSDNLGDPAMPTSTIDLDMLQALEVQLSIPPELRSPQGSLHTPLPSGRENTGLAE
ncbi:protein NYNRIN-like [Ictalurus furcatus]|uniref:protein NYNRIN-like n=1 Tax=Ictalurus furcatus TaxID=66913 RepID=UPI002350D468|nr:protein NYNRIN-like [Ictalurus furcatus]